MTDEELLAAVRELVDQHMECIDGWWEPSPCSLGAELRDLLAGNPA